MSTEKILIVEDDPLVREALKLTLKQAGYDVSTAPDGREAISLAERESFDLFIMDVRMPGIDGIESLSRMKESQPEAQSIVMTGYADRDAPVKALRLGAADYFYKPFDPEELLRSVRHHLEKCRMARNERVVSRRFLRSNLQTLKKVALLVEDRNRWFRGHSRRTAEWAVKVARKLELDPERIELLETAALLHDIGQIYVQEEILGKPGELTPEEREAIRAHPVLAREFLGNLSEFSEILYIIHHHHEWWNGKGYPSGLSGEEISIESRILSVCEAYDALISPRPHRGALSTDEAFEILRTHSGTQFDVDIVKTLISRVNHPEDGSEERALPEDRDTLGTLELLARAYEQVDSDLAVEAFQRLSTLSESHAGRRPLLRSLLSLASLYRRQGNLLKARTCVELLLEKSREQMDFLYRGEGLLLEGAIFLVEQRYGDASKSFQEASRHFSHLDRRAEKAKADLFLARCRQAEGSEFLSDLKTSFSVLESLSSVEHEDILLGERDLLSPVVLYGLRDPELRPMAREICLGWGSGIASDLLDLLDHLKPGEDSGPILEILERIGGETVQTALARIGSDRAHPASESAGKALERVSPSGKTSFLQVKTLGTFQILLNQQVIEDAEWKSKKVRLFLVYLLIHRGRAVGEDKIMETFWPGDPEKAQNSLYSTLHRLRKALERKGDGTLADPVLHKGKGYGFNTDVQHSFDVEEFEISYEKGAHLWESGQKGDAAPHFQRADRLYGGEFLEGIYEDWALTVRERVERKYLDVLIYLAQFYNEDGRFDLGIGYAERVLEIGRCEERAHAELMNGYFRSGKRDLAVRQYHTLCRILKEELGLSPSPPTVRLYLQITQA